MDKKIVIHISGNSCSGKSTIGKILFNKIPEIYLVSHDKMKWRLSSYHRDKDIPRMDRLEKGFFEVVCKEGIPILLECLIDSKKDYDYFKNIADKNGYKFYFFNLTCPENILLDRYHERIDRVSREGGRISVRSDKLFLENNKRKTYVPKNSLEFDSSKTNAEEIAEEILKKIKSKD